MKLTSLVLIATFACTGALNVQAVGSLLFKNQSNEPITVDVHYSGVSRLACSDEKISLASGKEYLLDRGWKSLKGYCEIESMDFFDAAGKAFEVLDEEFDGIPSGDSTYTITGTKNQLLVTHSSGIKK